MKIKPPAHIASLQAYIPGKPIAEVMAEYGITDVVKLASNENPLGPSPKGLQAAHESLFNVQYYPNGALTLRKAIADKYGLSLEEVIAGSGSEGVMNTLMRTFLVQGDEVLTSEGTFSGFYVLANAMGLRLVTTPLKNFGYDLEAILDCLTPKTKLIYIANPNNPTGSVFGRQAFESFYAQVPPNVLIVHDEAYYDFAIEDVPEYYTMLADIRPNVITLRTFSKSHGLAGIRIGFGTSHQDNIGLMLKVKLPFEPSIPAQAAGLGALEDEVFLRQTIEMNRQERRFLEMAFNTLGIAYVKTAANFFCVKIGSAELAREFVSEMERRGIIVRPLSGSGLSGFVRISIGTRTQNERMINALKEVLRTIEFKALSI
jgi:histidinol-phosphate aminotransferase